jgi:diguanylate cyclase
MKYLHDRRHSEELLRLAIRMMGKQEAAYDPHHYTICYEYVAGVNPELVAAIDGCLSARTLLNDQLVRQLYGRYISGRDMAAFDTAHRQLRLTIEGTLTDMTDASLKAGEHTVQMVEAASAFRRTGSPEAIERITRHANELTAVLERVASDLEARKAEAIGLIDALERSQAEPVLDPLTRLLNRVGLRRSWDELAESPEALQGIALLMIDIDRFKGINDSYGHVVGDSVLVEIARIVSDCLKPPQIAARLGGEEFVVVMPAACSGSCEELAHSICSGVARLGISRAADTRRIASVSVSIGIAIAEPRESWEQLLRRADDAMYRAKRDGGNRFLWAAV